MKTWFEKEDDWIREAKKRGIFVHKCEYKVDMWKAKEWINSELIPWVKERGYGLFYEQTSYSVEYIVYWEGGPQIQEIKTMVW